MLQTNAKVVMCYLPKSWKYCSRLNPTHSPAWLEQKCAAAGRDAVFPGWSNFVSHSEKALRKIPS